MIRKGPLLQVLDKDGEVCCVVYVDPDNELTIDLGEQCFAFSPDDWQEIVDFGEENVDDTD